MVWKNSDKVFDTVKDTGSVVANTSMEAAKAGGKPLMDVTGQVYKQASNIVFSMGNLKSLSSEWLLAPAKRDHSFLARRLGWAWVVRTWNEVCQCRGLKVVTSIC